jgi:homoserine dehydrogenase
VSVSAKAFQIGVIGFGTIGTGVVKILQKDRGILRQRTGRDIVLKTVADIAPGKKEGVDYSTFALTKDAMEIINDSSIDLVVELIGGITHAKRFIEAALKNKKHVVSANKELIAKHGKELIGLANEMGVNLFYEASSGGGIPIINALTSSLAGNPYKKIYGILNGTTNYILSKMTAEGAEFDDVLKEAQALGYAEADPSSDVDGHDVAYKLTILSSIAFDHYFETADIFREGIRNISFRDIAVAKQYGYVIKLLAIGIARSETDVELRVHPVMIRQSHPIASVNGSFNAVYVEGENVGETMFYGRGAGELPTASAVVGDIIAIVRGANDGKSSPTLNFGKSDKRIVPMGDIESKYYVRLIVQDHPGVLAAISRAFGDNDVSITTVQQADPTGDDAEIVIMTHLVRESQMQKALAEIGGLKVVSKVCSVIRTGL